VDWSNDAQGGKSPLHNVAISRRPSEDVRWQGLETAEFLLQNGASLTSLDRDHHTVLDAAVIGNGEREMIEYLTARGP